MPMEVPSKAQILDTALQLAAASSWEQSRLCDIASALNCPLSALYQQISTKDQLADAWFDRADQQMLSHSYQGLSASERLYLAISSWLNAMAPYQQQTGQMLLYKLEPGHVHLQAAALLRISATVQWLREAAALSASGMARIGQELALSALFVGVFVHWLNDRSDGQQQTLQLLQQKLNAGDKLGLWR